ncbi:Fur family transcriptional regulator, ferric uptake regulator [Cyclonatronum proteinivorum]|uniref:Fur family transcriptional regulator, ferric uptake regulator n=1 Tax=Cyclonatronum proteinivorum TaxID=1457365 RepID=A0A345UKN6_9BACT|nr:Fur family transcriptional regulator [Cyclonatronum proteinivorum]AXJ01038.1 Fur family transcriptional regulator, ferric uptake regulator [Cyclonatronum proteinivorum]
MKQEQLKKILRNADLKITKVRLRVLELLMESKAAMSHAQITDALEGLDLDKVTLYRTLNTFVDVGLAHKVATDERNWLYAIYSEDVHNCAEGHQHESAHAHFICEACDKIYCFPFEEKPIDLKKAEQQGFSVRQHEVRLHGTCPVCK